MHWISLPLSREAVCAGSEGGLQGRFVSTAGSVGTRLPLSGVVGGALGCWTLPGGAVRHLQTGDHAGMGPAVYFQSL